MKQEVFTTKTEQQVPAACPALRCGGDMGGNSALSPTRERAGVRGFKAFTLAEILITLGIIGVVASLTMPGLIRDYQNRIYSTANMVFENRLGEAMRQMNINDELIGYTKTEDFVEKLKKYMKIIRVCEFPNAHECFAPQIGTADEKINTKTLLTSDNFIGVESQNWGTDVVGIILQNGTSALLAYNPNCTSSGITAKADELLSGACLAKVYDTNGKKHPNQYGKDLNGDMAGKAFWIKVSPTLKIAASDVSYTPVSNNWHTGAKNACTAIGGTLPSSGLSGTAERYCKTAGAHQSSEACALYKYCEETGSCSGDPYWLKESGTNAGCSPAAFALNPPASSVAGRLTPYCTNRSIVSNAVVPKARCVKPAN